MPPTVRPHVSLPPTGAPLADLSRCKRLPGIAVNCGAGGVHGLPDAVTREAYSHEVSSAGFWPGNDLFPHAAFYSYAYPEPQGFKDCKVPEPAHYETALGEFILRYDDVRRAADPDRLLLDFLMSTYTAAAETGRWDRAALECDIGTPGRVRSV